MKPRKATAIGCGALLLLVIAAVGLLAYGMFGAPHYYATGVAEHELAPTSATSIEVFETRNISGGLSLSYRASEEAFRKFAAEQGWPLSPGSGKVHVRLPSDYHGRVRTLKLENYLHYEKRYPNGGGISVCFIPAESRAYIHKSNR